MRDRSEPATEPLTTAPSPPERYRFPAGSGLLLLPVASLAGVRLSSERAF
jgi:hypothetical protein